MTVTEFTKLDANGAMFQLIDATKPAYFTNPQEFITGDKNAVRENYGDKEVVYFELLSSRKMRLYIK